MMSVLLLLSVEDISVTTEVDDDQKSLEAEDREQALDREDVVFVVVYSL
jgi:hypothetical protein